MGIIYLIKNYYLCDERKQTQIMNMTIDQLNLCYSLLNADDVKIIAKSSSCSIQFVRAVLRGDRTNADLLRVASDRVKGKISKMTEEFLIIEKI